MLVSSTSFALAHSVLASRLNSCARKSSRRPTAPPRVDQLLRLGDVRGQPVELLAHVGLGGEQDRFLMQAIRIETIGLGKQRSDLLGEPRADRLGHGGRAQFRHDRQRLDLLEPRRENATSAAPSRWRISDERGDHFDKPGDRCGLRIAPFVFVFFNLGDFHHALERKQAVERRRARVDARTQAPAASSEWHRAPAR